MYCGFSDGLIVRNSKFWNIGVQKDGQFAIQFWGGNHNARIHNNIFDNMNSAHVLGEAYGGTCTDNVFEKNICSSASYYQSCVYGLSGARNIVRDNHHWQTPSFVSGTGVTESGTTSGDPLHESPSPRLLPVHGAGRGQGHGLVSYFAEVMADTPVAYYRMGRPRGRRTPRETGNNTTVSSVATPTYSSAGSVCKAIPSTAIDTNSTFDTYFQAPDPSLSTVGDVTLECWVKRTPACGEYTPLENGTSWALTRCELSETGCVCQHRQCAHRSLEPDDHRHDESSTTCVATKNGSAVAIYIDGMQGIIRQFPL